jgi:hypothetical protein
MAVLLAGSAAAQTKPRGEPYRLGDEEAARRLLFCVNVYEDIVRMHADTRIKSFAAENAAKSAARALQIVSPETHALLSRIAKDSFQEQIDGAWRAGGVTEHYKALGEFETDCNKLREQY